MPLAYSLIGLGFLYYSNPNYHSDSEDWCAVRMCENWYAVGMYENWYVVMMY